MVPRRARVSDTLVAPVALPPAIVALEAPGSFAFERVDTYSVPTCGEFLTEQILPLYVLDIPFHKLKQVVEDYGGIPLDSDDEDRALKSLGRPGRHRDPKRASGVAGVVSALPSKGLSKIAGKDAATDLKADVVAPDGLDKPPLSKLHQVAEKSSAQATQTSLRHGMNTSVVEKRAKNVARSTPSDMVAKAGRRQAFGDLAKLAAPKPARAGAPIHAPPPAATPVRKDGRKAEAAHGPSLALLKSPAGPPSTRGKVYPATPMSLKKRKRSLLDELPDVAWDLGFTPDARLAKTQKLDV